MCLIYIGTSSTQPPPIASIVGDPVGAPEEVKNALLRCLKEKSPIPATVRCAYPLPIPPAVALIFNLTTTTSPSPATQPQSTTERQSQELLMGSDGPTFTAPESITADPRSLSYDSVYVPGFSLNFHRIQKRSLNNILDQRRNVRVLKKRLIDENPTINLMKYYVKHQVWKNSNPSKYESKNSSNFEVNNELPVKHKRSIFRRTTPNYRRPVHTLQLVKQRIKTTLGTHFHKNREQMMKLKSTLDSIRSITYKKSVTKAKIHRRSVHYEDMFLPRIPDEPTRDISYYVKNKEGTNVSPNLLQAAQVRLGLQQAFQTGNIEVVRRYGSNYNPLVPSPFYAGVLRSAADV
ncbi:uncharacterized protein LOC115445801 [Manduca sexta]|uniref:uncharacterized protein LOC115445801 n=1 Tax=Manduca sexta TaxID=7130 RepID=UPI00188FF466|nr:uncharacterized protein LOC115445801 [Manduca sexta]